MNFLSRWSRRLDDDGSVQAQLYYDRSVHKDPLLLDEASQLVDAELRHSFRLTAHRITWGFGHRYARDLSERGALFFFSRERRSLSWSNVFVQDQIRLTEDVEATLGTRFERTTYTGWEVLPNFRLGWKATKDTLIWSSLSRAVRAPSRLDREINAPPFVVANNQFQSETANVAELGTRSQITRAVSVSLTAYYQKYDRLKTGELTNGTFPVVAGNKAEGTVSGFEGWGTWQVTQRWRLMAGFATVDSRLRLKAGSTDPVGTSNLGNNPDYQWQVRSYLELFWGHTFDVAIRRVSSLPVASNAVVVPAYTAVDIRYAIPITRDLEVALIARNAFDPSTREWGDNTTGSEINRSVAAQVRWRL